MALAGTTSGGELLLEIDRASGTPLRAQLEQGLRQAVRGGRLTAGARLPPTRALAEDLGLSRRLVVEAYAQLLAEGYLQARRGAGTFVAQAASDPRPAEGRQRPRPLQFDFFPGSPDLAGFPRQAWLRAYRAALRDAADAELGYPDPQGAPQLRAVLAGHLRRVRGLATDADSIVVCSGTRQALALLARVHGGGCFAVEDPTLPVQREVLAAAGAQLLALGVDGGGAEVERLGDLARGRAIDAVLVTPAHQAPLGVALSTERRAALLAWARAAGSLVLEDDYDAEFRFDRAPLAALQGLDPERVVYLGTASKTLAPGLRLGWMALPRRLVAAVVEQRALADAGSPMLDQLALARLIEGGEYDRHLRQARRRYRLRRDALVAAAARHLPQARVTGIAAGLHAVLELGREVDALELMMAARRLSVGVYPLGYAYLEPRPREGALVLGYASLAEPAIEEGIRRLALALEGLGPSPAPTNDGGAISR